MSSNVCVLSIGEAAPKTPRLSLVMSQISIAAIYGVCTLYVYIYMYVIPPLVDAINKNVLYFKRSAHG